MQDMSDMSGAYSYMGTSIDYKSPNIINSRKNIIAGPKSGDYWYHSKGAERPLYREEGPFPVQGNVGFLMKQEADNNYASCTFNSVLGSSAEQTNVSIGAGPNCTGVFNADMYTTNDTCGSNCFVSGPESYGIKSFGMLEGASEQMTNIHGLHAYENIRAGSEGRGPSSQYGCYEFLPRLEGTSGNGCTLNYSTNESRTVGDWTKLGPNKVITNYSYGA